MIDDEEWVQRMLEEALKSAGYGVTTASTAESGADTARNTTPDCIICDLDLPDHEGTWVIKQVRAQPSRVSVTPFLLLSSSDDPRSRVQGLHLGGDAYMTKPFLLGEVMAQVAALVQMAARLRKGRESLSSWPPDAPGVGAALSGDLAQVSAGTLLQVLGMEGRSGSFEVQSGGRRVQLDVVSGFVTATRIEAQAVAPIEAFRALADSKEGRFSFTPQPARDPPPGATPIGGLLVQAARDRTGPASAAPGDEAPGSGPIEVEPDMSSYRPPG